MIRAFRWTDDDGTTYRVHEEQRTGETATENTCYWRVVPLTPVMGRRYVAAWIWPAIVNGRGGYRVVPQASGDAQPAPDSSGGETYQSIEDVLRAAARQLGLAPVPPPATSTTAQCNAMNTRMTSEYTPSG